MKLSALTGARLEDDPEITGIATDSRAVKPGNLFAALAGARADGASFIAEAERRGAAAVLAAPGAVTRLPLVADPEPRQRLSKLAARFFPRQPAFIAGVTGTNGKTSTAVFTAAILESAGHVSGSIGTLGAKSGVWSRALSHTTPEPVTLHQTIDAMAAAGVTHLAMEVSSHAIAQHRADGVAFRAAAFTNITQDHLDFHRDFDDYFSAKRSLFERLLPKDATAVVNLDGAGGSDIAAIARARGLRLITTGERGDTLKLLARSAAPQGQTLMIAAPDGVRAVALPLVGAFQADNALVAVGLAMAAGLETDAALAALESLPAVPGRMQYAASVGGGAIYIDYAHTPDAVSKALSALRPHASGRIILVLGAGGDRDRAKRPLMGRAGAAAAEVVIVTDDNPRSEDPASIRKAIIAGAPNAIEIGDRAEAIAHGVAMLADGDVLLVAGKGHEQGQIVGDRTIPFDDLDVAQRAAANRREIEL